jgi:hypothetical protein
MKEAADRLGIQMISPWDHAVCASAAATELKWRLPGLLLGSPSAPAFLRGNTFDPSDNCKQGQIVLLP